MHNKIKVLQYKDIDKCKPLYDCVCVVTDGEDFAIADYHKLNNQFYANDDLLEAYNYDGGATIYLNINVKYWAELQRSNNEN